MPINAANVNDAKSKTPPFNDALDAVAGAFKDNRQPTAAEIEALRAESEALKAAILELLR